MKLANRTTVLVLALVLFGLNQANGQSLGTSFTYQGKLKDTGVAADGLYDLRFKMFDAATGGTQIGGTIQLANYPVTDGLFTVELDFGAGVYNNNSNPNERWLEVLVEQTTLSPRQPLTGVPYSIQTRGLDVVEDGAGMKVGVGRAASGQFDTFNVFTNSTGFEGMTVETPAGGSPLYAYKSGNNQSVYHYLDFDDQAWRLRNAGERIFVDAFGFVGINKDHLANDDEVLGVYKNTSGFGGIIMETNPGGEPYFGFATNDNDPNTNDLKCYMYYDDDSTEWILRFPGLDAITVQEDGEFEINHPAGIARKPGGGPWFNSSDRRLKKNINNLEGTLEKLLRLRGVTFEYKDPKAINELDGVRTGFIAQEVEKVFPDWIAEHSDGYKMLASKGFEALAVEALRELRKEKDNQIEVLENENDDLRERMDTLEAQMQQLMTSLPSK